MRARGADAASGRDAIRRSLFSDPTTQGSDRQRLPGPQLQIDAAINDPWAYGMDPISSMSWEIIVLRSLRIAMDQAEREGVVLAHADNA